MAGFSLWLPGKISTVSVTESSTIRLLVKDLRWGNQKGLPFECGADKERELPAGSFFEVELPGEEGGIWLNAFGAPGALAASTVKFAKRMHEQTKRPFWRATPAHFVLYLPDDAHAVGGHRTAMEKKYLAAHHSARHQKRLKKNQAGKVQVCPFPPHLLSLPV